MFPLAVEELIANALAMTSKHLTLQPFHVLTLHYRKHSCKSIVHGSLNAMNIYRKAIRLCIIMLKRTHALENIPRDSVNVASTRNHAVAISSK